MPRQLPRYVATFVDRGTNPPNRTPPTTFDFEETQIRRAIRTANFTLRMSDPAARRQVTIRGIQPGEKRKRGTIEYQAHIGRDGKIHVEER